MSKLAWLVEEIEETLTQERQKVADATADDWHGHELGLLEGWVEALEYVLHQMDALDGGAQDLLSAQEYGARWLETHEDE